MSSKNCGPDKQAKTTVFRSIAVGVKLVQQEGETELRSPETKGPLKDLKNRGEQ